MPDILSQEEIDALRSAAADVDAVALIDLLAKYSVEKEAIARFFVVIDELGKGDLEKGACEKSALLALDVTIEGKSVSKRQRTGLRTMVKARIATQHYNKQQEEEQEAGEARKTMVMPYDFKHPARVNRNQLRTLENLHDNFARLLSASLSETFHTVVDVDTAFIDQTTYAEFILSLSNPALSYQFTLGPTNGQVILDLAMPVVFATIDHSFGGSGNSQGVSARQVTPIEIGEINTLAKRMFEDLESTWEPVLPVQIDDVELETNPEFMQVTPASEIVIVLAFEVNSTNCSGLITLCYPFFTLEPILPLLGPTNYVRYKRGDEAELRRQNLLRLGGMELPVKAEVGTGKISVADARRLKAGDVIVLETHADELAVVYVDDKPKYLGYACTSKHGKNSVKVAGLVPATEQEKYRNRG